MNFNYTSICHYCGKIYKSIWSTSKYCCTRHNSLYSENGSRIDFGILDNHGIYANYHEILSELYNFWPNGELIGEIATSIVYLGPRPKGDELLLVSGFIIQKSKIKENLRDFAIKPMCLLTKEERACSRIVAPDASHFIDNRYH